MLLSELNRQKELLRDFIRQSSGLDDDIIGKILGHVDSTINSLMKLMKDGKSAHEKFFSDIILHSIDAIIGFDNNYKIFLWNKGAEDLFHYQREEVMGRDFSFIIPEHLLKKGEKEFLINEVKEKGFLANHESERITKEGDLVDVSVTRFAIYDEQKQMIGSVGILRDITQVKKLEKVLREKENLALIGEVVSSIAHSLSNPLNIISGNADYLLLNKKPSEDEYEELNTILQETTRITKSIRHLLNFSRPISVEKTKGDLNEIIQDIIGKSKYIIGKKNISVKKSTDNKIPSAEFDKAQIEEVILNIFTNAVQAIPSTGEIKLTTSQSNGFIKVEISDNGPGIPKENIDKIFQPFYSSKEYGKGTGLGLSIAKRIISEHNGLIDVKSSRGKGTTFTIALPV
jgi:PAS domain S-box-containing protein